MRKEHLQPFVAVLQVEFYVDDEMFGEAIQKHSCFKIIHRETMFKVVAFMPRPRLFFSRGWPVLKNRPCLLKTEISAQFASPEDTVPARLEWYRIGGEASERLWRDILVVLKMCANTHDLDNFRKRASGLKVSDLLERALQQAA